MLRTLMTLTIVFTAMSAQAGAFKRLYSSKATASSYLQNNWNKYNENYHPNYALDDNKRTAWVEGVDGNGEGEALTIRVSPLESAKKVKLRLRNGYQKSKKLFKANSTPRQVVVSFLSSNDKVVESFTIELANKWGWQEHPFEIKSGKGFAAVRLQVKSVYPGKVYKDTCLSDVQISVVSDVPYNKKIEQAKRDALRTWAKDRIAEAAYFAKLPKSYPFAGTSFREYNAPETYDYHTQYTMDSHEPVVVNKDYVSALEQLKTGKAGKDMSALFTSKELKRTAEFFKYVKNKGKTFPGKLHKVTVQDPYKLPDGLNAWVWMAAEQLIDRDRLSFFEATSESYDAVKKMQRHYAGVIKWERSNPRVQWADEAAKRVSRIYLWEHMVVEERSTYEEVRHYIAEFDKEQRLTRILCYMDGNNKSLWIVDFEHDDAGKISLVRQRNALHATEGEGEIYDVYRKVEFTAEQLVN